MERGLARLPQVPLSSIEIIFYFLSSKTNVRSNLFGVVGTHT